MFVCSWLKYFCNNEKCYRKKHFNRISKFVVYVALFLSLVGISFQDLLLWFVCGWFFVVVFLWVVDSCVGFEKYLSLIDHNKESWFFSFDYQSKSVKSFSLFFFFFFLSVLLITLVTSHTGSILPGVNKRKTGSDTSIQLYFGAHQDGLGNEFIGSA